MDVTIRVDNAYACGRESSCEHTIPGPAPGQDVEDWFDSDDGPFRYTGDGHACGGFEDALHEVTILAAPGRPELEAVSYEWGG